MAQYDGSIRFNTKIETKEANAQLMALENRMVKTADKIASLRSKMDTLKDIKIPTQEYANLDKELGRLGAEYDKIAERQSKFLATGGKEDSTRYRSMEYDLDKLEAEQDKVIAKMKALEASGKAFILGGDTEEYARLSQQLQYAQNDLAVLNQRHKELSERQAQNRDGYKRLGKAARDGANVASKSIKGVSDGLKTGFKNILKYAFGIRSLYVLVGKIRTGIKEGFSNFANYSDSLKKSIDGLKGSFTTLKNSFAAAFAPIVEIAIPYIQKLIDYLSTLFGMIGRFVALVSGQKTYTKAIKQTTGAIEDQTSAQNKQLSGLDKLNNLSSGGGGGADAGAGTMFEEVPIDSKFVGYLDAIKERFEELRDIFNQGFWDGLGDWEYRIKSIGKSVSSVKESLKNIFLDPAVIESGNKWVESVAYMLGSLAGSVTSIGLSMATNFWGGLSKYLGQNKERIKKYLVSMFDIRSEIDLMFADLFQSIAYVFEAFASEQGQQLTANIIGIFADAFMGVTEIASKLTRDVLNIFIRPFVDNQEEFRTALEDFLGVLSEVTGTIKDSIDSTFDKMNEVYDEHLKPFFDSVADGLSDTAGKFLDFWNNDVQPVLDDWAAKFDDVWKEHIQPALNNFIDLIGKVADFVKMLWEKYLKPFTDWMIQYVYPIYLAIADGIVKAVMTVFGAIGDVVSGVIDTIGGIIDFLTGVFTGDWEKAWDGIVGAFSGIFNQVSAIVEGVINGAIDIINGLIGGVNAITSKIPDALGIGIIPEIGHVSIPRLATGAVIPANREFLAVLGDQKHGTNIEAPLDTIKQAVREEFGSLTTQGNGGDIELHLTVECEGYKLLQLIQKLDREQFARTQRPSFQI